MSLKARFEALLEAAGEATRSASCALRLRWHMLATVLCPERATLTNLICTSGQQQNDWSAHYRLYSHERVDEGALFSRVRQGVEQALPAGHPLVVAIDDTLVRKCGTHIHGVGWKRDPLGPPFQTNLVRGQRYVQLSAAWPLAQGEARMVPIAFHHAPSAPKPPKGAGPAECRALREAAKQATLNAQSLVHMKALREATPAQRPIVFNGDGSYTNRVVLRGLPAGCTYLGRMRRDAVLHYPPDPLPEGAMGRRPSYGRTAPTPEALRTDESVPWQKIGAFAAGQHHEFRVKTLGPVLWRKGGAQRLLRIIVIAPLSYRLRQGARLLYRQPAYLLCSDPDLPLDKALQYYLWRWGIEVNFRDEKTLLGTGQAQVRSAASNQHQPAVSVASYALLWVAALQMHDSAEKPTTLSRPKWRGPPRHDGTLPSTGELIRQMRYESWSGALRPSTFHHFVHPPSRPTSAQKLAPSLPAALFAAA